MPHRSKEQLLTLPKPGGGLIMNTMFSLVHPSLKRIIRLNTLNNIYSRTRESLSLLPENPALFLGNILQELDLTIDLESEDLKNIPGQGPVVVVANHPFGAVEGIILAYTLLQRRSDVKIMANYFLSKVTEIQDVFIFVDPLGGKNSVKKNIHGLKSSLSWLNAGGLLGVFPAGEVSSVNLRKRKIEDPVWNKQIGGIIKKTQATVVPIHFAGGNGPLFHLAGMVHPRLRTIMLPREMIKKTRKTVSMRIGSPIPPKICQRFHNAEKLTNYLRLRTYNLRYREDGKKTAVTIEEKKDTNGIFPGKKHLPLRNGEIHELPRDQILLQNKDFNVLVAQAEQIPFLMEDIGYYREKTFSAVGEGTGNPLDLDQYDRYYKHLILWDKANDCLAGAYRIGEVDRILHEHGGEGVYSCSLFTIQSGFFEAINPALELGRSFIREEYQKQYAPLLMLWKGIGAFVARNPRYISLFGPVSISNEYVGISKKYMVEFLQTTRFLHDLAKYITPKTPPRFKKAQDVMEYFGSIRSLEDLTSLIRDIEPKYRDIPVLLRQYLKLGGNLVGFNLDYSFNNTLDGLILLDMRSIAQQTLQKFMGKEQGLAYRSFHAKKLH